MHWILLDIERGIINSVLTKFRVKKEKILPLYFLIMMRSEQLQREITSADGTGIKNLRPISEIKNLRVPVPSIREQEEIIDRFNKLRVEISTREDEIELMRNEIDNLIL